MTPVQERIREYIVKYKREHNGISPTLRRMVDELGLSSTSVVHYHIGRMCNEGVIYKVYTENKRFGIGVPNSRWEMLDEK